MNPRSRKILDYFLPPSLAKVFEDIRPYGPIILIAVVMLGPMFGVDILGKIIFRHAIAKMQLFSELFFLQDYVLFFLLFP